MKIYDLTAKQGDLLRVIHDHHDGEATTVELKHMLGYSSTESVKYHMRKLADVGLIEITGGEKVNYTHTPLRAEATPWSYEKRDDGDLPGTGDSYDTQLLRHRIEKMEEDMEDVLKRLEKLEADKEEDKDADSDPSDPWSIPAE